MTANGGFSQIATTSPNITAFFDGSVVPNTTYYYRVKAYDVVNGGSNFSNVANATTFDAPAAPSNLVVGAPSSSQALLIWQDNSSNENGFRIERSIFSQSSGFIQIGTTTQNTVLFIDNSVSPATTYWYRVAAFNATGTSPYSNVDSVTIPGGGPPMGILTITIASTPVAQTIVSGVQQFTFANYLLNALQSGEDIRMSTVPLALHAHENAAASNLTSCQLYDGSNSVTTGSNVVNPVTQSSSTTFTFDGSGLAIPRGMVKTLALKCNVAGGATGAYSWGIDSAAYFSATGLTSGQAITPTATDNPGQKITLSVGGSYAVVDDSTPGYRIITAGSTGVVLARLKFSAVDEAVDIQRISLQLSGVASNTPLDLINQVVTLYDEANPTVVIGTAQFGAGSGDDSDRATSTIMASGVFRIPAGGSKVMLVKGDIAGIASNGPLTASGDLLKVDYNGGANGISGGNYGIGLSSGTSITPSSGDTAVQGVRIMKAYPVFTKFPVPTNALTNGLGKTFYRFSVQTVGGDIRIAKFTFNVSSTTGVQGAGAPGATTTKYSLYAYTDSSFLSEDTSFSGTGLINAAQCYGNGESNTNGGTVANTVGLGAAYGQIEIFPDAAATACGTGHSTTTYKVPAGLIRYFDFRADVANVESMTGTESLTVTLKGDAAFPTAHQDNDGVGEMGRAGHQGSSEISVDSDTNDDFIWSPNSTSSAPTLFDYDFTNGYQVLGLPANDMPIEIFTSPN